MSLITPKEFKKYQRDYDACEALSKEILVYHDTKHNPK